MSVSDEREILFTAKEFPERQKTPGYSIGLFSGDRRKKIARAISDCWEDDPKPIDDGVLSARSGLSLAEIGEELKSCYKLSPEAFQLKVNKLNESRLIAKLKNTSDLNFGDIEGVLEEWKQLQGPGSNHQPRLAFAGTLTDFFKLDLPEADVLIEGLLARQEFMLIGGVKHSHKTTCMEDLGLQFTAGRQSWLNFPIPRPGRFLMIQQELGEAEFRKRLSKAAAAGQFESDNFIPYTGTGNPIRLIEDQGVKRLSELAEKFKPDIIGLDPLHTFIQGGENEDKSFARVRDIVNEIKVRYNCAVILSHHFSSKRPKDDPLAPAEAGGWFRGHSVLSDAADVLFLLHRLPGQKDNPNLRLSYEDYNMVEVTLRNGKWPPRFAIEFDEKTFLLNVSSVWSELGAKIGFGEVREVCEAHGGSILLAELILYFKARDKDLSPHTVKKAADKEAQAGYVTMEKLPGKGRPLLIKSK